MSEMRPTEEFNFELDDAELAHYEAIDSGEYGYEDFIGEQEAILEQFTSEITEATAKASAAGADLDNIARILHSSARSIYKKG